VLLHEEDVRPRRVARDAVDAVTDLGLGVGDVVRPQAAIDRSPRRTAIVGAEGAGSGDGHDHVRGVGGVQENRVQTQAAGARLPLRTRAVTAQAGQLVPRRAPVGGTEERGVLDAGVHRVGIDRRRREMPHALECPRVRRPVVPLVGARFALV